MKITDEMVEAGARALYARERDRSARVNSIFKAASGKAFDTIEPYDECADGTWRPDARAALEAALELAKVPALKVGQWQPIETAPKDGTAFLAIEAFNRVDEEDNLHPGDCEVVKWSKTADGWIAFGVKLSSFEPTHWMPLPLPPGAALSAAPPDPYRSHVSSQVTPRMTPGLYRVTWMSGGSSLVAIGCSSSGDNWIAPTNWIAPAMVRDIEAEGEWAQVERYEQLDVPAAAPPVEYAGLVERLQAYAKDQGGWHNIDDTCEEAADAITALEARARDWAEMAQRTLSAAREWQDYCEKIERDTDAAMAEEIQRLRRDLPKAKARIRELEAAVLAEREACAVIAEARDLALMSSTAADVRAREIAAAIRARTQADAPAQPEGAAS